MLRLILWASLIAGPAAAAEKWIPATTYPPPGHTCEDLYRARDLPETFGPLYVPPYPIAAQYCTPVQPWWPGKNRDEGR